MSIHRLPSLLILLSFAFWPPCLLCRFYLFSSCCGHSAALTFKNLSNGRFAWHRQSQERPTSLTMIANWRLPSRGLLTQWFRLHGNEENRAVVSRMSRDTATILRWSIFWFQLLVIFPCFCYGSLVVALKWNRLKQKGALNQWVNNIFICIYAVSGRGT